MRINFIRFNFVHLHALYFVKTCRRIKITMHSLWLQNHNYTLHWLHCNKHITAYRPTKNTSKSFLLATRNKNWHKKDPCTYSQLGSPRQDSNVSNTKLTRFLGSHQDLKNFYRQIFFENYFRSSNFAASEGETYSVGLFQSGTGYSYELYFSNLRVKRDWVLPQDSKFRSWTRFFHFSLSIRFSNLLILEKQHRVQLVSNGTKLYFQYLI